LSRAPHVRHVRREGSRDVANQVRLQLPLSGARRGKRSRGLNFGKKGKKESQVFTSVADNPRQGAIAIPSLRRVWRYSVSIEVARW